MNKLLAHLTILLLFIGTTTFAQLGAPTPCSITNVISLNTPSTCGVANAPAPYTAIHNNTNYGNEKNSPFFSSCNPNKDVTDVWFTFYATSNSVKITIDSSIQSISNIKTPQFTIYQATNNCKQPKPIKCFQGTPNISYVSADVNELIPLTPYYLQVSGAQLTDTGSFRLTITPYDSCTCLENAFLSLDPLPVSGYYSPGQKVTVCLSVIGYNSSLGNAIHGIVPNLGPGWDLSSITNVFNTLTIDQKGLWSFYPTGVNTPLGIKQGFFYETNGDGNPANNKGDYGNKNDTWFFCFDIKTKAPASCTQEQDLSIKYEIFSDAQTGSNTNAVCPSPNILSTMSKLNCCLPGATIVTTPADCNESCDATATVKLNTTSQGPFVYEWYDNGGALSQSSGYTFANADTINNLCVNFNGDYVLYVTDSSNNCSYYKSYEITYPVLQIIPKQEFYACPGECLSTASITNFSPHVFKDVTWYNQLLPATSQTGSLTLTDSLCAGFYEIQLKDTSNACSRNYEWFIFDSPPSDPYFSYPKNQFCSSETGTLPDSIATGGGKFFSIPSGFVDSISGALQISSATPGGNITIYYITGGNTCKDTGSFSITISIPPPSPVGTNFYTACLFDTLNMSVLPNPPNNFSWYLFDGINYNQIGTGANISYSFNALGNQAVFVYGESGNCKGSPLTINVQVNEGSADAGSDIEICSGNSTLLNATGGNTYLWTPSTFLSNDKSPNPICTPDSSISYLLKVISQSTCPGYDTLYVKVINSDDCIDLKPVNAFSPNNDGINDYWFIDGIENTENEVSIYNRWGNMVWNTKNYNNFSNAFAGKDFNGKLLTATTYFYLISTANQKYSGWLEIIR